MCVRACMCVRAWPILGGLLLLLEEGRGKLDGWIGDWLHGWVSTREGEKGEWWVRRLSASGRAGLGA